MTARGTCRASAVLWLILATGWAAGQESAPADLIARLRSPEAAVAAAAAARLEASGLAGARAMIEALGRVAEGAAAPESPATTFHARLNAALETVTGWHAGSLETGDPAESVAWIAARWREWLAASERYVRPRCRDAGRVELDPDARTVGLDAEIMESASEAERAELLGTARAALEDRLRAAGLGPAPPSDAREREALAGLRSVAGTAEAPARAAALRDIAALGESLMPLLVHVFVREPPLRPAVVDVLARLPAESARRRVLDLVQIAGAEELLPAAARALVEGGPAGAFAALEPLHDSTADAALRFAIVEALLDHGVAEAIPWLIDAIRSRDPSVRARAAERLVAIFGAVGPEDGDPGAYRRAGAELRETLHLRWTLHRATKGREVRLPKKP